MANKHMGEVSLDIGGTSYTLKNSVNGMIDAEDASEEFFGRRLKWDEIGKALTDDNDLRALRLYLYGLLRKHHPDVTPITAGDLIDDAGGLEPLATALSKATVAGAPDPVDITALGVATKRPRKARVNGTGGSSTSPHVASA